MLKTCFHSRWTAVFNQNSIPVFPEAPKHEPPAFILGARLLKGAKIEVHHQANCELEAARPKRAFFVRQLQHHPFLTTQSPHGGKTKPLQQTRNTQLNRFESPRH